MVEHHLQKEVLQYLIRHPSAGFAELKPKSIDSNVFTYHLHQLIKQKLVAKQPDKKYALTARGRLIGINVDLSQKEYLEQAHSIYLIVIRDKEGKWLLRKRKVHPMYGKFGFVHGEPSADKDLGKSAQERLLEYTGISASLDVRGCGYIKMFAERELESFVSFTLLFGDNPSGSLHQEMTTGENIWLEKPDFSSDDMIPSMQPIVKALEKKEIFFLDLSFKV